MRDIRRKALPQSASKSHIRVSRDTFFFYEKHTGAAHFRVEADPEGRLPADQAAALLAMHCLVRGQSPGDYVVMVEAADDLLCGVAEKAEKLLHAGRSVPAPVRLSRREEEVLSGVMRSLANKEIAATLNLSERTIKFHVSSLLSKFRVRGRMELVREASRVCLPARAAAFAELKPFPALNRHLAAPAPRETSYRPAQRGAEVVPLPKRQMTA